MRRHKKTLITLVCLGLLAVLSAYTLWRIYPPNRHTDALTASVVEAAAPPSAEDASPVYERTSGSETGTTPYVEITGGCGPHFEGACVPVYATPGTSTKPVAELRKGIVLAVGGMKVVNDETWYKIAFNEWLLYPGRIKSDWYVSGRNVRFFEDQGAVELSPETEEAFLAASSTKKRIVISRSKQMLYAYVGDTLVIQDPVSTGVNSTPTPRGTFVIYRKSPTRYMQGPIPGETDQPYDFPGVPWDMYFTHQGAVIHGAYWHSQFGKEWSNGCVNLSPADAKELYAWAPLGTKVFVEE